MTRQTVYLPADVELLPVQELTAGNLTCLYEHGNLRYIRLGDEELLRMIYTAVRDKNWATAPYTIEDEVIETGKNSFVIQYTAQYGLDNIRYKARVAIEGRENKISFSMKGEALSNFYSNRIGICVLHPIKECAGTMATIIHPGGSIENLGFPVMISPHQPFKNIQQLLWQTPAGEASLFFDGDVFETEDQRNWSDASYKTYSTPLERPVPVLIKQGEKVEQKVRLQLTPHHKHLQPATAKLPTQLDRYPFPKIGYERAYRTPKLTAEDFTLLREIIFDHYRVNLYMDDEGWQEELNTASEEAALLNVPIELVVFVSSPGKQFQELTGALQKPVRQISSILLLETGRAVTPPGLLREAYPVIKSFLPETKIGYGTDHFFAELNRNRPDGNLPFDFVSYSLNPQVHANDTRSLLDNLQAPADTIMTAQSFTNGKEIFVSPITFEMRSHIPNSQTESAQGDQRLYTSFGALWTLNVLKNLAGAASLTLYQAKSYRGVINEQLHPGAFPLYQWLKELKKFKPTFILVDKTDQQCLVLENGLANQWVCYSPVLTTYQRV